MTTESRLADSLLSLQFFLGMVSIVNVLLS